MTHRREPDTLDKLYDRLPTSAQLTVISLGMLFPHEATNAHR